MAKKPTKRWSARDLARLGIPSVLIPGLLLAVSMGWNPKVFSQVKDYYEVTSIFPESGVVGSVSDGDTFTLENGRTVRLIGMNAPDRGDRRYETAKEHLTSLLQGERVYLEYDHYQDDKYGRVLAWVWIGCNKKPSFLPANYMQQPGASALEPGKNPKGCEKGALVNEAMVKAGWANTVAYKDRGSLKYEQRLTKK